jgi:hypothetical protein
MMCPHGGTVMPIPGQTQATADAPVLRMSDTCTIIGCALIALVPPSPCVMVQWVQAATRVQAADDFVLNEESVGLCLAATQAPQGTVLIVATQPAAAGI